MNKFYDSVRKQNITVSNVPYQDYMVNITNDQGVALHVSQQSLYDGIRSGRYISLG